jgi:hypothetical protein
MKNLLSAFLFFCFLNTFTQIAEIKWQKCYGNDENVFAFGIVSIGDGYLFGLEVSSGEGVTNYHGSNDIWLVRTDSVGVMLWEKCYGGSSGETTQKLIKKSEDEYFIFGYAGSTDGDVQSGNNGFADLWVIKINGLGDILWEKTYGCTGVDNPKDMILTPDGGFVMIDRIGTGGGDVTHFYGIGDCWMAKCDSLGNLEWEKTLGNDGLDNCVSMIVNSAGNLMMIGATQWYGGLVECFPDGAWGDVWIVELDLQGNILAQYCYGGSHYDLGLSIIETEDGYVVNAGTYSNDGDVSGLHGSPDMYGDIWVIKLDKQMGIVWQKCLGGYRTEYANFITQTDDGGFVVIGTTNSNDGDVSGNHSFSGDFDIWVVKMNGQGELLWQQCYGGKWSERLENPHTVLKKSDYNYVFAASSNFSPSFDVQCGTFHNYNAWLFEIALDDTTHIINPVANEQSINIFPNPTSTEAWLQLPANIPLTDMQIELYNPTGMLLYKAQPVSNFHKIETAQLPVGLYVVRMWDGSSWQSGRLVVR